MPYSPDNASRIVFVLGMHRSGTSALAGMLEKFGADFGTTLMEANGDNPKGFFENQLVVNLDDKVFALFGRSHDNLEPMPHEWWLDTSLDPLFEEAETILASEFVTGSLKVIKDPRISRLLPFWLRVCQRARLDPVYVEIVRHPEEVANSLARRNGYSRSKSRLLWLLHVLDAGAIVDAYPRRLISFNSLMADWLRIAEGLADHMGLGRSNLEAAVQAVDEFLDPSLRHHRSIEELPLTGPEDDIVISNLCTEAYALLMEADGRKLTAEPAGMAGIRARLVDHLAGVVPWLNQISFMDKLVEQLTRNNREAWAVVEAKEILLAEAVALHSEKTTKLAAYSKELDVLQSLAVERDGCLVDLEAADALLQSLAVERDACHADLEAAHALLEAQYGEFSHLAERLADKERLLASYIAERATFCATLMRTLTGWRQRYLPLESTRGKIATNIIRFLAGLYYRGWQETLRQSRVYLVNKIKVRVGVIPMTVAPSARATTMPEYTRWIAINEPGTAVLAEQRLTAVVATNPVLFSVILPVYKVPSAVLRATIDSLLAQTWPHWEACIAYADADNEDNWCLLKDMASRDSRIHLLRMESNAGISGNSNTALGLAHGEFVVLLDHDDELTPWALFEMAERISLDPEVDFLYSDKDCIDEAGSLRLNPLFKPTWSPEMLFSVNYLTHLCVMRRALLEEVGGWRPETDGAQDWDIFYRVTERARKIVRVVGVQYHWRIIATSVSTGLAAKPYVPLRQLRTQEDRVRRLRLPASVVPDDECGFRLVWRFNERPCVDVVVDGEVDDVNLARTLITLNKQLGRLAASFSIVRPQGASKVEGTYGVVEFEAPEHKTSAFFAAAARGQAPVIMFVDARLVRLGDICARDLAGWAALHPGIAFAGAVQLTGNDTVVEAGRVCGGGLSAPLFRNTPLRHWGWFGGPLWFRNISAVTPALATFKRIDWQSADSVTGKLAWPDAFVMQCQRAAAGGRRGLVDPHARVWWDAMQDMAPVWHPEFSSDPFFHPAFGSVSPLSLREESV